MIDSIGRRMRAEDLVPSVVLRRVVKLAWFRDEVARYLAMSDDELLRVTEVCLRNLGRLSSEDAGADADLRIVLVPELWERIRPGTRDALRRISSSLAEYEHRVDESSFFRRLLSPESRARLDEAAERMRVQLTHVAGLDVPTLVEQARFAIAGSRAADTWPPCSPVYEPGFAYRLVPAVACRALAAHGDRIP